MKIFQASKSLAALTKQFTAAGLNIDDFINAADETALQAHLESIKPAAPAPVDVAAATACAVKPYAEALVKFGAQVKASDEKAGVTSADIETALKARASIMAQEQLAKHGLPTAITLTPAGDATQPAVKAVAKTDAEHLAHYESLAEDSAERRAYGAQHYNAIRRADQARGDQTV